MQKKLVTTMVSGVCLFALATGCVKQNEYDSLQARVQTQDQQLRQLQPMQADAWAQMQAMRQELNALKGQMDDLNNAGGARALVDRVSRHDAALRQIESAMALNLNLDAPAAVPGAMGAMTAPAEAAPGMPTSGAYGAAPMGESGALPPGEAYSATGAATPSHSSSMSAPAQQGYTQASSSAAPTPPKDMATALYDAGVTAFNARKYQEAQRSFVDFTKKYGTHKQASNAWYYIGECNFQRNQFADAALAYDTVITKFGNTSRAPAAYLKQGICFSKLGQGAAAKARMQELIKKYPNTPEAARAKNFLQTNK